MDSIRNRPMDERSIVARENANSLMIKRLVFGVAAGALALAPSLPAQIGTVNPELNVGVGWTLVSAWDFLEGHIGYDFDNGAQRAGRTCRGVPRRCRERDRVHRQSRREWRSFDIYGELSFSTGDDIDRSYGGKTECQVQLLTL